MYELDVDRLEREEPEAWEHTILRVRDAYQYARIFPDVCKVVAHLRAEGWTVETIRREILGHAFDHQTSRDFRGDGHVWMVMIKHILTQAIDATERGPSAPAGAT